MWTGDEVNGTATATVATVGTTARDALLAPEAQATISAATGLDMDVGFVDEHLVRILN
jgi:hypothetical protein